jgi:cysteinyl-tRNA synthetase
MSKSAGNFYTLRDLKDYSPVAIRYLIASAHYRSKLNFTLEGIKQAEKTVENLNEFLARLEGYPVENDENTELIKFIEDIENKFIESLDDDLNISRALGYLFIAVKEINTVMNSGDLDKYSRERFLEFFDKVDSIIDVRDKKEVEIDKDEIERLINERNRLRKEKKYAEADKIRDKLSEMGIVIQDGKEKTTWYVKK